MDSNLKALADAIGRLIVERWFGDRERSRSGLAEPITAETNEPATSAPPADVVDDTSPACLIKKRKASR